MKTVLITGAVKNTGLAIARLFASRGWQTVVTSRNGDDAEKTAGQIRDELGVSSWGFGYDPGDIHYASELKQRVNAVCGHMDCVVLNSANLGQFMDPLTVDIDDWASVLQPNLIGAFSCAREFAKDMAELREGTIIFIGSINYRSCLYDRSAYIASKGGICSLTRALALDLGKYNIRVNCLVAGAIHTSRYDAMDPETVKRRNESVPIGRVATGEDVAKSVYFLATEESGNMNGSCVVLDGGTMCLNGGGY